MQWCPSSNIGFSHLRKIKRVTKCMRSAEIEVDKNLQREVDKEKIFKGKSSLFEMNTGGFTIS